MRNRRALLYLILSVVSGAIAFIAYRAQNPSNGPATTEIAISTTAVVIAASELTAGHQIEAASLDVVDWPTSLVPAGTFQSVDAVVDRVTEGAIHAGEPIFAQQLLPIGHQGGLTALIEDNHRAMSVRVDAVVGVGGFIKPGARVDVLAQLRMTTDRKRGTTAYSRTILQNVKVLAIDQNFQTDQEAEAALASVVTLQVTPEEAQRLAYGAAEGSLQLALRAQADDTLVALKSTKPDDFLDALPPKKVRRSRPRASIESIRGSITTREYL